MTMPVTFVKICGITRLSDARAAVRAGANALGFVFATSPRRISPLRAFAISRRVHPSVRKVGVFVDAPIDEILGIVDVAYLDAVQLQGKESPEFVDSLRTARPNLFITKGIRAISASSLAHAASYSADAILFDRKDVLQPAAPSRRVPLEWMTDSTIDRLIVAGGLNPQNVGDLVKKVAPWGVDVSGGVEVAPGKKDIEKMRLFVRAVREAEPAFVRT